MTANTLIFDDADAASEDMLGGYHPAIFGDPQSRVVAIAVAPDRGLAKYIRFRATKVLRWRGRDPFEANPALGHLFTEEALERSRELLPADVYRREHLGLFPAAVFKSG